MDHENQEQGDLALAPKVTEPKKYKVLIHNDDFTPMDFVVHILVQFFNKPEPMATQIMLDVHKKGYGVAGVYILEIAEMKAMQVQQFARLQKYPLKATVEPE